MDWRALVRSRRIVAVCLFVLVGSLAGIAFAEPAALPSWDRVSPSLTLDEPATEELIHEQINGARDERNLTQLTRDDELTGVARNHSQEMADRAFFNHTTPGGIGPPQRVDRAGIACQAVSENIVKLPRQNHEEPLATAAVEAWLDSAGHLMNIVADNWSRTGVGVVATEDAVYITQVFCS